MATHQDKKKKWLILAAAAGTLWLGVYAFRRTAIGYIVWPPSRRATASDVPVVDAPNRPSGHFVVRAEMSGSESILIGWVEAWGLSTSPSSGPVYRYDGKTRRFQTVNLSVWESAQGPVTYLGSGTGNWGLESQETDGVFKFRIGPGPLRNADTKGKYALGRSFSPTKPIVAVLSGNGPGRPPSHGRGMLSGSTWSGYYGQHYVELFHIPRMSPVGTPVRIPLTSVDGIRDPVWSDDGRFLVYSTEDATRICVIHADEEDPDRGTD